MSGAGEAGDKVSLRWLLGPSGRIGEAEDRSGARLLAALTLVHLLATSAGAMAGATFFWHVTADVLLRSPLGWVLLAGALLVLVAYVLVRAGRYRPALAVYVGTTASFPLLAPFVGHSMHEVGLLAAALVPMAITATLLARRWLIVVAVVTVSCAAVELTVLSWPRSEVILGFTILVVAGGSSALMAAMRRQQGRLAALHAEQMHRSEDALRASHERVEALLAASRDLVVVLDATGTRKSVFGGVEQITGYEPSTRGPRSHFEAIHPEDRARVQAEFAELLKRPGQLMRTEWRYLHRDGQYRWHEGLLTNRIGQAGIDGVVANVRDITERKMAEENVTRNERRYRTLFETVTDGIFLMARDGHLIEVNDAACRMLGYPRDELLRMRMEDVIPEERREHLAEINRTVAEQRRHVFEAVMRRKDGCVFPVEVAASFTELDGAPVFMGVSRDITDRTRVEAEKRRLQAQLQHAMKMESIGRLAGGVAHDFNNLLTAILGNAELALFQSRQGADVQEALSEIRETAISAATVTRQLLTFSRKHVIEARPVDVNGLLQNMHKMLERVIGEDVRLRSIAGQGLGIVKADPGLLEQTIMNLVVNARDAMPHGGELVLETASVTFDEGQARAHRLAGGGEYLLISVSDTGTGMSEEVKRHLFEPFFTTKPRGKGTGLGLATAYAAIEQSGGSIEVTSTVGEGTTFRIYLPVVSTPGEGAARLPGAAAEKLPGGRESILVVEDDGRVREMVTQSLRAWGYEVTAAATGEEGLALADARTSRIDLLLTDVILPGMNGREMARALAKVHPETRTLFTSGYGENIIAHAGSLEAGIEFLGKPYTMDSLALRVREILDRR